VSASDADGLASVNLWYRPPGATKYLAKPMTLSGGKYVATLDTTAENLKKAGELRFYVLAKDQNASPKTTKLPKSGYQAMTVKVCVNTGPKITLLTATPTSIIADPLGAGCSGSTLSELRARATDVDGVKGIRLYFKKPGATAYTRRDFSLAGGTWTSFINTVGTVDDIVRSGSISWYVVATDTKGATSKSAVKTIQVTRCDSEATQFSVSQEGLTFALVAGARCGPPPPTSVLVRFLFSDADGPAVAGVTLTWTLQGVTRTANATRTGLDGDTGVYDASISTSDWGSLFKAGARGYMDVVINAVDRYGGKTSSDQLRAGLYYRCQ
jgi:hypothetical protein